MKVYSIQFEQLFLPVTKSHKKKIKKAKKYFSFDIAFIKSALLIWFPFCVCYQNCRRTQKNQNQIAFVQKLSKPVSESWQEIAFLGEYLCVCLCLYVWFNIWKSIFVSTFAELFWFFFFLSPHSLGDTQLALAGRFYEFLEKMLQVLCCGKGVPTCALL